MLIVGMIVGIVLAVFDIVPMGVAVAIVAVSAIIDEIIRKSNKKAEQAQTDDYIQFHSNTNTLEVNKKSKLLRKRLKVEEYKSTNVNYTPEKLIYTSATVGGITTGGVSKVGGVGSEKLYSAKCELFYEYLDDQNNIAKSPINRITLSNDLLEKARNSIVSEYLEGNSIVVVEKLVESTATINGLIKMGNSIGAMNVMEQDKVRTLPTRDKCNRIIRWLCE